MMPELTFSEVEPFDPVPVTDWIGEAFSRRFAAPFEGKNGKNYYAHIRVTYCLDDRSLLYEWWLLRKTMYTICTHVDAPLSTEVWSVPLYDREPADPKDVDQARRAAAAVTLDDISWPAEFNQAVEKYATL